MEHKKHIVGVFGTANTGKSTFINDLIANTANREDPTSRWQLFGDNYRDIITAKGLQINRNGTEECQQVIHDVLVNNIIKACDYDKPANLIMDRTIIDSFVYTYWHHKYGTIPIKTSTLDKMWKQVLAYSRMFDLLIWIPLELCKDVKVVDDHFRDTDLTYRTQIDAIMAQVHKCLTVSGCKTAMISGTRDERVDIFINVHEDIMRRNDGLDDFSLNAIKISS